MIIGVPAIVPEPKLRQVKHPRWDQPVAALLQHFRDDVEGIAEELHLGLAEGDGGRGEGEEGVDLDVGAGFGGAPDAGDGDLGRGTGGEVGG